MIVAGAAGSLWTLLPVNAIRRIGESPSGSVNLTHCEPHGRRAVVERHGGPSYRHMQCEARTTSVAQLEWPAARPGYRRPDHQVSIGAKSGSLLAIARR